MHVAPIVLNMEETEANKTKFMSSQDYHFAWYENINKHMINIKYVNAINVTKQNEIEKGDKWWLSKIFWRLHLSSNMNKMKWGLLKEFSKDWPL